MLVGGDFGEPWLPEPEPPLLGVFDKLCLTVLFGCPAVTSVLVVREVLSLFS